MAITTITKYLCDGKEFDSLEVAQEWEAGLEVKALFKAGAKNAQLSYGQFSTIVYNNPAVFQDYLDKVVKMKAKQ